MILKGSQRGGAKQLATHLLNSKDNEHIDVHEVRGFIAENLHDALMESYAISRGTKCVQHLFSLSLNPPQNETASNTDFENALIRIEERMGLTGQPRALIFHEKEGRRHAHAVWSRINSEEMKAIHLPHYKLKLREVSRELFLEHGWQLPKGLINSEKRNPANFTLAEWQQAKRTKQHPKTIKALFQECWAASDSGTAFEHALKERGYLLARGDRRSFVALDYQGEVFSIPRMTGQKTKTIRERLGSLHELPDVQTCKVEIGRKITHMLRHHIQSAERRQHRNNAHIEDRRQKLVQKQREERHKLSEAQEHQAREERRRRAARLSKGLRGIWDFVTGNRRRILRENQEEEAKMQRNHTAEHQSLINQHLDERRKFQVFVKRARTRTEKIISELGADVLRFEREVDPCKANERTIGHDPSVWSRDREPN